MSQRSVKIIVSGRVQGVYFRKFTQKKARQLAINGCVRNLPDGRVEIVACSTGEAIQNLISWCHKGPLMAKVRQVDVADILPPEIFSSFEIR